jgi:hypothetical protein
MARTQLLELWREVFEAADNALELGPLTDTRLLLAQHSYLSLPGMAIVIHLALGATILVAVWFARLSEHQPSTAENPNNQSTRPLRPGV